MLAAERGAADNTLQAYRRDLEDFLAFLERQAKSLAAAAPAEIGAYMRALSETGLAPASRARRLSAIRQLFKFLVGEGVIAEDPALGFRRPQAGPSAAQDALGRRGRSPDRGGAPAHRGDQGPRPRAGAAPACADRDALRHRPARHRARHAAALGAHRRRPRPDRQGQGRARAHRPPHAGGARRARPLSQRRPGGRRRRRADDRHQVAVRLARRRGPSDAPAPGAGAQGAGRWRPASMPSASRRTCCATPSPAICSIAAPTCARCSSCSATPTSRPRRSTPTCWRSG